MSKSSSKMSGRSAKRVKKSNNTTSEVLGDSRFGFLDLPPELRNWVYDYVAHDDDPNDRPPALHYYPDDGPRRIVKRAPLRQGFALTQTCRLIRYEYLPLYQAQARVSCSYQSLRACCIEKDDAGAQLVLPLGKTIVEYRMKSRVLDEDGRLKRPVYDTEETDLLALIRAAQRTPNLQLEFALAGIAPAGQIEVGHLFNLRGNPTWNKALDEQIERLRMLPESVHLIQTIAIEVKVEYTEDWMARQFYRSDKHPFWPQPRPSVKKAWLTKIGLGDLLDARLVQVYKQHPHPLRRSPRHLKD